MASELGLGGKTCSWQGGQVCTSGVLRLNPMEESFLTAATVLSSRIWVMLLHLVPPPAVPPCPQEPAAPFSQQTPARHRCAAKFRPAAVPVGSPPLPRAEAAPFVSVPHAGARPERGLAAGPPGSHEPVELPIKRQKPAAAPALRHVATSRPTPRFFCVFSPSKAQPCPFPSSSPPSQRSGSVLQGWADTEPAAWVAAGCPAPAESLQNRLPCHSTRAGGDAAETT